MKIRTVAAITGMTMTLLTPAVLAARPSDSAGDVTCGDHYFQPVCAASFSALCDRIEISQSPPLANRTKNGLITKVLDADSKVAQRKYDMAYGKLEDIINTIDLLNAASNESKQKIDTVDYAEIHASALEAQSCDAL